jgi:hypothetical protein
MQLQPSALPLPLPLALVKPERTGGIPPLTWRGGDGGGGGPELGHTSALPPDACWGLELPTLEQLLGSGGLQPQPLQQPLQQTHYTAQPPAVLHAPLQLRQPLQPLHTARVNPPPFAAQPALFPAGPLAPPPAGHIWGEDALDGQLDALMAAMEAGGW